MMILVVVDAVLHDDDRTVVDIYLFSTPLLLFVSMIPRHTGTRLKVPFDALRYRIKLIRTFSWL